MARVAARSVTVAIRTRTGEHDLAVGIAATLQTHGSRATRHPHRHRLVTDGGCRPDGTLVTWPVHDTARLTEAFRRPVLRCFVRWERFDEDQAADMLTWPHAGFHVKMAVWVPEDACAFATRLARSCARHPVALDRLTYDRAARHRPRATTRATTRAPRPAAGGRWPHGGPAPAALRGRLARVPVLPRREAQRCLHHADVGAPPDPHPPPDPCLP
ncbi:MAG: transposase [Gemmatimonadota bacterium]